MKAITFHFPANELRSLEVPVDDHAAAYSDDDVEIETKLVPSVLAKTIVGSMSKDLPSHEEINGLMGLVAERELPEFAGEHGSLLKLGDEDTPVRLASFTIQPETDEGKQAAYNVLATLEATNAQYVTVVGDELARLSVHDPVAGPLSVGNELGFPAVKLTRYDPIIAERLPEPAAAVELLHTTLALQANNNEPMSSQQTMEFLAERMEALGVSEAGVTVALDTVKTQGRGLKYVASNLDFDAVLQVSRDLDPRAFEGADLVRIKDGSATVAQAAAIEQALLAGAGSPEGGQETHIMVANAVGATAQEWRTLLEQAPGEGALNADRAADLLEKLNEQTRTEGSDVFSTAVTTSEAMSLGFLGQRLFSDEAPAQQPAADALPAPGGPALH